MKKLIVLVVMLVVSCAGLSMAADAEPKGGAADAATSVRSGKSNSDNRLNGGNTDAAAAKVKSGKSNSSDRGQGGGGAVDAGSTVKSSKSNSSE